MDTARHIVATLIHRKRFARSMLRNAESRGAPAEVIQSCRAALAEAHNAAEVARRILYHGVDAV